MISVAMDLQSPSILAQLPRPLHASTGKTRIGDVYSLADAKKRKRYEVAVAVDGEAVNIYNVGITTISPPYLIFQLTMLSLTLGANPQTRHLVRRAAAIFIFLQTMLCAPQVVQEVDCQETNIHRRN